tara:strand:- start:346 stop:615 length:270 start_codon:yes stop_codon:yes gene_type:complete
MEKKRISVTFTEESHARMKEIKKAAGLSSQDAAISMIIEHIPLDQVREMGDKHRAEVEADKQRRTDARARFNQLPVEEMERLMAQAESN